MVILRFQRTHDCKMQSIQKTYVASTTLMFKAASELTKLLPKHNKVNLDIKTPLSLLKNSLSLAGNVNQALNQYRCDIIKPTLPSQFVKIAEAAGDSSAYLFGDSLTEKMDRLQKESRIKYLLKDLKSTSKQSYGKRTYQTYQDSSNYQSSSKTKKRTNQGQSYKKESTHAQNKNQQFRRPFHKSKD